jgi:hypothetical protein
MSTSYLDLHLAIDNEGRLKGKIYHKHVNFTFPIVNFKLISSNISATSTYGVYIFQPIPYPRIYVYHIDVVVRAQLLSQQNNQTRLRSSKFEPIAIKKIMFVFTNSLTMDMSSPLLWSTTIAPELDMNNIKGVL